MVRSRTDQALFSDTIHRRRLSFFGHHCRADTREDHSRALQAYIQGPPNDWRCRTGRPRQTWLRTVENDMRPLNFGRAWRRTQRQGGALWIDRHGVNSWRGLRLCGIMLRRQRERERQSAHCLETFRSPDIKTLTSIFGQSPWLIILLRGVLCILYPTRITVHLSRLNLSSYFIFHFLHSDIYSDLNLLHVGFHRVLLWGHLYKSYSAWSY